MDNLKPQILDWLSSLVNHEFKHHFSDKWISINIYNDTLNISFDFRQPNQVELFNKLPDNLKGCLQYGTGKKVNEKNLYFKISDIIKFEYPSIKSYKLLQKNKHQESEKGGWYIKGSYWYSYDWEILLSDGNIISYNNQKDKMDLKESDFIFKTKIQEYQFKKFIKKRTENLPAL
jgi:hypothetical protein